MLTTLGTPRFRLRVLTTGIAIFGGIFTGLVMRMFEPVREAFSDEAHFIMPEEEIPYVRTHDF